MPSFGGHGPPHGIVEPAYRRIADKILFKTVREDGTEYVTEFMNRSTRGNGP